MLFFETTSSQELKKARDANTLIQLAQAFAATRELLRLSQRMVARRMDTQQSAISDIEKGLNTPRLGTTQRLARALGTTLVMRLVPDYEGMCDPKEVWAWEAYVENGLSYENETWTYNTPIEETIITDFELDFWLQELTSRPYELVN